jgi:3-hydroxyisobutyrate dehydrogenase-like beta-hydroxyacid dehydrogenase
MAHPRILLLGFGEVGQALVPGMRAHGAAQIAAYDVKFSDLASGPSRAARRAGVPVHTDAAPAAAGADLVICAVTADQSVAAAISVAGTLGADSFFLDLNSVAPQTRRAAAAAIERAGGRYVEAAVMSPIAPRGVATPMLFGGVHAAALLPVARALGFSARIASAEIGRASAVKLCRSVFVKGMEALTVESLSTARFYGVEDEVLASLVDFFPGQDWPKLAAYFLSRALQHGTRRAAEMDEAAKMVADAGTPCAMSTAIAATQLRAGQAGLPAGTSLTALADHLREHANNTV